MLPRRTRVRPFAVFPRARPPSNYASELLAPRFTELTGIAVEFETTSWDQMYTKAIRDMEASTGIYDFVCIGQNIIYSYLARDFLVNISASLADMSSLKPRIWTSATSPPSSTT